MDEHRINAMLGKPFTNPIDEPSCQVPQRLVPTHHTEFMKSANAESAQDRSGDFPVLRGANDYWPEVARSPELQDHRRELHSFWPRADDHRYARTTCHVS